MEKKSKKKLSALIRSDIRKINYLCMAGAERIFIQDCNLLTKKYSVQIFTSAKTKKFPKHIVCNKIFYPHLLIDFLKKYEEENKALLFISNTTYKIFELFYSLQFIIRSFPSNYIYTLQTPSAGLFFPKKTTVLCQNYKINNICLFNLFKNKYKKVKYIFCSKSIKDEFLKFDNIFKKGTVLHNYVELKKFSFKKLENKEKYTFGFIGTWNYEKGLQYLVEIIKILNKSKIKNKIKFIIVGNTDHWSMSDEEINKLNILKKSIFSLKKYKNIKIIDKISYPEKTKDFYKQIDFLIFPSLWKEPFGNVLIESMSCGTPAIAFKENIEKQIIQHNKNGFLVKKKSILDMSATINKIINEINYKNYKKISKLARLTVEQKFSKVKRLEKINHIITK